MAAKGQRYDRQARKKGIGTRQVGVSEANGMDRAREKGTHVNWKGGTAVLLCLKRQFAGLRYGLYITVQLLWVVGDSSVDSELPFCTKGDLP